MLILEHMYYHRTTFFSDYHVPWHCHNLFQKWTCNFLSMPEIRRCNKNNNTDDRVVESKSYYYNKDCIAHSSARAVNKCTKLECKAMLRYLREEEEDASWAVQISRTVFSCSSFQLHYQLLTLSHHHYGWIFSFIRFWTWSTWLHKPLSEEWLEADSK